MLGRPLLTLLICGGSVPAVYLAGFTLPYALPVGLVQPLLHFGRITGPSLGPTVGLITALAILFGLYAAGARTCVQLEGSLPALAIVVLGGALSALILLPMFPIFSQDIFYYMSANRIWSVYHQNPFVVPPLQVPNDTFFPYTSWGHYPLPYGPLWPWITQLTSTIGGDTVPTTLVAFKTLAVASYLLCLPLCYWTVSRIAPTRRLTGLCIFGWNPLVLLELAGGGHNDAVALVPAIVALALWARRLDVAATGAAALSFLTKATMILLIPALWWPGLRRARASHATRTWAAWNVGLAAALFVAAWLPFWGDGGSRSFLQEADQYYNSLTALAVAPARGSALVIHGVQAILVCGFGLFYLAQLRRIRVDGKDTGKDTLKVMWRGLVVYFLVVSPFYSAWYMVWPTLLAALIAERRTTVLTALLCIGALGTYLVQFVLRPIAMPPLNWTEMNAVGLAAAAGPFILGLWALQPRRERSLTAQAITHR